jgi:hypothetical protein
MIFRFKTYAVSCVGLLLSCLPIFAEGQPDENLMKVVAIEKISRFIRWPDEEKMMEDSREFIIGVFGQHPVAERAGDFYAERPIKNRAVEIRQLLKPEDAIGCHIIYVSESIRKTLPMILEKTGGKPILTVGDSPGYAEAGILVNLYIAEQKLRFEINEAGFHKAGLQVAPILLKVADIVDPLGNIE